MIQLIHQCKKHRILIPQKYQLILLHFIFFSIISLNVYGQEGAVIQSSDSLYVQKVNFFGNTTTKRKIITRELSYREGYRIPQFQIDSLLALERSKILNTSLFSDVEINYTYISPPSDSIAINISVREKQYFWPRPILEPADRSLVEWVVNRGAALNRVNYGFNFAHRNAFGLGQSISATAQFGFQRKFSFRYRLPFIDKKQRTSLSLRAQIDDNNTTAYITSNNKFVEVTNEIDDAVERRNPITRRVILGADVGIRRKFYGSHSFGARFFETNVDDTVAFLNPSFFLDGRTTQRYFQLSYEYTHDRRDLSRYPLKGYLLNFSIEKLGIGVFNDVDVTRLDFTFAKYFSLGKEFYYATSLSGKISNPSPQPYIISRALGYQNNIVRGLDPFVVEGEHVITFKNSIRFKAIDTEFSIAKLFPTFLVRPFLRKRTDEIIDKIGRGNLMLLPKIFFDAGYVKNSNVTFDNASLSNKPIWGTGFGADLVLLRSLVIRFEYSFSFRGDTNFAFENDAEVR